MGLERFRDVSGRGGGVPPRRRFPGGNNGGGEDPIGRVPPHSIEAEMAVLGAMLLGDRAAVERAMELVSREDFYRDAHGYIFDAMVSLNGKGEPIDIITLQNEMNQLGTLEAIGIEYLLQLSDIEFTTSNVAYYAQIVSEKATLRRLIEAASRIASQAYGEVDEVTDLVDQAERLIFEVARKRSGQGFTPLRPLLTEVFENLDSVYQDKGVVTGVDTGFIDLNAMTSGLQEGDLFILAARPSMGKCLTGDSRIVEPFTGERIPIREYVARRLPFVSRLGSCHRVGIAPISHWVDSGIKPCWRVTTSLGRSVEVTGHHPFLTETGWTPLHDISVGDRIAVPRALPIFGRTAVTPEEARRQARCSQTSFPAEVWTWTRESLATFLQALLGAESGSGSWIVSEPLARDIQHALTRFGIVSRIAGQGEQGWCVEMADPDLRTLAETTGDIPSIYWDEVIGIEPIGEQHVYDLTVPDGANFVAEDIFVHNTSLALGIGQNACLKERSVAVFSLEMSKEQLVQRMICSEARVDAHRMRTGFLKDSDWDQISAAVQRLWDANLFIDDTTEMSALEMRARCRRLQAEYGLDLVIVDYLQLMRGSGRADANRNEEITTIARGLKGLARELRVPVIALSQLSRAVERREDKRPMLSDLRECLAGASRLYAADTGRLVPIADIRPGDRVLAVNAEQKVVAATVSQVWNKGKKQTYRLTTETGRMLECTDNHPFLTQNGYKPLCELASGDLLATMADREPDAWEGTEVFWERMRSIEPAGAQETFDICVPETGNFLAEGITVHNSGAIEAEADLVAFIYRPAYYERKQEFSKEAQDKADEQESPVDEYQGEEAEVIIAKHRNGPTGTVKLAFLPKYARFDNLEYRESPF